MNSRLFWIVILIIGIGLIISANIFRDQGPKPAANNPEATNEPTNSPEPLTTPRVTPKSGGQGSLPQAVCQISGEIKFINPNLYETIGAKIAYQNVDDEIRQIYWKSNPDDGLLSVGPNLFEGLEIPNGEREIGVVLKNEFPAVSYFLTASITYGVKQTSGAVEEKIANCSGTITVKTPQAQ